MELSPRLYHYFVRPKWFLNKFYNSMFQNCIEFKDKTVLDFGCGIGSSSYLFESSNYLGVDCDDKRINYAKKLYPEYNFITTKDGLLPLSQNSVDYIMILSVLHHIPTEELTDSLKEFKRVLKSDGNIIIVEPCFFKKARMRNWYMSKLDKGKYIRNEDEYLDLFRKANYKTKVIKRYNQLLFYNKIMIYAYPDT
ncbi:class I SAM-dependent methyltransferase [Clostridium tetanomorphum]|uniref:Class I SAM-dependent methyltransferase n=1 Tax=Clostridium tetanomorphum TaxID=1553 RepID=A0A923ECF7_CLOTT|nr:class I SAM-dependent methyltransferase [Clostridium tetanomorphum]MBC2398761.1 class I SAM-dependent methyltransferase [Clostridium tetanomorphum]NRZ99278.1 ubiquinone/menaquinone biosynthesis C-methylase UbiE [Clostridium tetanomorphum]